MNTRPFFAQAVAMPHAGSLRAARALAGLAFAALLAACGGHADAPLPNVPPIVGGGGAPTITTQPADLAVTAGQQASFSVVAGGDATLAYQWKRAGSPIAGATAATYTLTTTTVGDSSAVFNVVVSNGAGSVASNAATLTVTASAPVLTIIQQPANTSVVAGATASFTVAATCSSGTLGVQWQRSSAGSAFADLAGATTPMYSLSASIGDHSATFRASLNCSGQSVAMSQAATLTVTPPGSVTVSAALTTGVVGQADIGGAYGIVRSADGSYVFTTAKRVMRLAADLGSISKIAGQDVQGSNDGPADVATFSGPQGLVEDGNGALYIADTGNQTVRRVAANGVVSTLAGSANAAGAADGAGAAARFSVPRGIALGPDGDLYVADSANHRIRRVSPAGVVTTYAGSTQGFADGMAAAAQFNLPVAVAVAANGDVLVADNGNHRVRRILRAGNGAGNVETLAGNGTAAAPYPDGIGTAAVIKQPLGLLLQGNALTVRDGVGLLRQVDLTSRVVSTVAGSRTLFAGYADGSVATARLSGSGVAVGSSGGFLLADSDSYDSLRSVDASGSVRTIATSAAIGITPTGTGVLTQMPIGLGGPSSAPPQAVTVDPSGNIVVVESLGQDVRRIAPSGTVSLIAGLTGAAGPPAYGFNGVDGTESEAQFRALGWSITSDAAGILYVVDSFSVRRIGTDKAVTTIAGSRTVSGAVNGSAAAARFAAITSIAVAANGDLYVAEPINRTVRRIDTTGNVTTYSGAFGQQGTADGPVATARLSQPTSVAFAPDGALLVADAGRLRRIAPDGSSVMTLAAPIGTTAVGNNLVVDPDGTVYYGGGSPYLFLLVDSLWMLPPGATTPTLLVPYSNLGVQLGSGSAARVGRIDAIARLGPKQLVVLTDGQIVKVTVP